MRKGSAIFSICKGFDDDIHVKNFDDKTPLQVAQANGHQAIVDLLKQYGATG